MTRRLCLALLLGCIACGSHTDLDPGRAADGGGGGSSGDPGISPSTDSPSFFGYVITGFNVARSTLVVTTSRNVLAYGASP